MQLFVTDSGVWIIQFMMEFLKILLANSDFQWRMKLKEELVKPVCKH